MSVTKEELLALRERVGECKYVWVKFLGTRPVAVSERPGGPETMADGTGWYRFVYSDDVRRAVNALESP